MLAMELRELARRLWRQVADNSSNVHTRSWFRLSPKLETTSLSRLKCHVGSSAVDK
jgi:hypothetical protein